MEAFGDDPALRRPRTASLPRWATTWATTPVGASGSTLTRADRLPTAIELFADGPHIATRTYEIGNPDLDNETSWGFDASFGKREGQRHRAS